MGQFCSMGECYTPQEDGSCGTLCNKPDAGRPIVIPPKDGGVSGGGTGGCGCVASENAGWLPVEPLSVLAFGVFALARRRRRQEPRS